eukprot:scaffold1638_cov258-Pinguiococcus_pyrenoidosus.AAC.10
MHDVGEPLLRNCLLAEIARYQCVGSGRGSLARQKCVNKQVEQASACAVRSAPEKQPRQRSSQEKQARRQRGRRRACAGEVRQKCRSAEVKNLGERALEFTQMRDRAMLQCFLRFLPTA